MNAGLAIDVGIAVLVVIAGISGYRQGVLASAMSLVGLVIGAVAGILIAPRLISGIDAAPTRMVGKSLWQPIKPGLCINTLIWQTVSTFSPCAANQAAVEN